MRYFILYISVFVSNFSISQSDTSGQPRNLMLSTVYENEQTGVEKFLKSDNKDSISRLLDSMYIYHQNFYPPALFAASKAAYDADKKHMASFFFYLAQLKTKIDINLSKVPGAFNTYKTLTQVYGERIENFCLQNIDSFKRTVIKVIEICDVNEGNYDHKWVALHSSLSKINKPYHSISEEDVILPKEDWAEIKLKILNEYYVNFLAYLESKKKW